MDKEEADVQLAEIEAFKENWDTYGAPPFAAEAIAAGRRLVDACYAFGWPPDRVSAGEGIGVYWRSPDGRYADIETGEDDSLWAATSTGNAHQGGITVWQVTDLNETLAKLRAFVTIQHSEGTP